MSDCAKAAEVHTQCVSRAYIFGRKPLPGLTLQKDRETLGATATRHVPVIDYDTPRFKSSQVAAAAGFDQNNFRTYFKRGQFRMLGMTEKPRASHGLPHMFSLRDAMGFAVAAALMRNGVPAKRAFDAAMLTFAHTGSEERLPGQLFDVSDAGFTILLYWSDSDQARVIAWAPKTGLDFGTAFCAPGFNRSDGVVMVFLNQVERAVFLKLAV